mmetsp:Transcript_1270/g.3351  ORF Transcript_1270/g.3351 Transcript_1270/m.3351 type:complete len:328 (+) Transcript_1270:264-1247(+)
MGLLRELRRAGRPLRGRRLLRLRRRQPEQSGRENGSERPERVLGGGLCGVAPRAREQADVGAVGARRPCERRRPGLGPSRQVGLRGAERAGGARDDEIGPGDGLRCPRRCSRRPRRRALRGPRSLAAMPPGRGAVASAHRRGALAGVAGGADSPRLRALSVAAAGAYGAGQGGEGRRPSARRVEEQGAELCTPDEGRAEDQGHQGDAEAGAAGRTAAPETQRRHGRGDAGSRQPAVPRLPRQGMSATPPRRRVRTSLVHAAPAVAGGGASAACGARIGGRALELCLAPSARNLRWQSAWRGPRIFRIPHQSDYIWAGEPCHPGPHPV